MAESSESQPAPPWWARIVQILALVFWFGIPAGLLTALFDAQEWRDPSGVLLPLIAGRLTWALGWALGGAVLWLALLRLSSGMCGRIGAGFLATGLCLALPGLLALQRTNRVFLPGRFFSVVGLGANTALVLASLALIFFTGRALASWASRRPRAGTYASIAALAAGWGGAQVRASTPDEEGVDVIVLLIDVLGADDLGCYGYERPTSPNIDAFAADSVVFENAIASSTYTKTSVASLFSGRFPHNHGVYDGHFPEIDASITADLLEEEIPTLAESFSEHGWTCAGWTANGQILSYMGFAQGFDLYDDRAGELPVMARKFGRWSDEWLGRKRSFCYLHVIDLHAPYNPGPDYRGRFGHTEAGLPEIARHEWHATRNAINQKKRPFGPEDVEAYHARHDEVLVFVDEWVGRILDELEAEGRYDQSLIVLLGDHGDAFWEHGFIEHSHLHYEELVNVPLIIKLAGSAGAGRRVDAMVGLVDVAPTLLELVGAEAPEGTDGESFSSLLLDPESPAPMRTIFSEYKTIISVRTDDWKYISRPRYPPELYDLKADPGERVNVLERYPEVAERLSLAAKAAAAKRDARRPNEKVELDRETVEALRELGYL